MTRREIAISAVAMGFAIILGAAVNWWMFFAGFVGVLVCIGILICGAANISLLPHRQHYDCGRCKDTGIEPGGDYGSIIMLPVPCAHCPRGGEVAARMREHLEQGIGGVPAMPSEGERVQVVVDFLSSWRFCPVSSAATPSRDCLEDAARQLLDALDGGKRT